MKVLKLSSTSELWYQKLLLVSHSHPDLLSSPHQADADIQDDELNIIFSTGPPAPQGSYEVPARARAAYLKASGRESEIPEEDREPEISEGAKGNEAGLNRKDPIGEDCPV